MTKQREIRATEPIPPPAHLSARARGLWAAVVPARAASPQRQALIQTALEALDRAEAAREQIEQEGMLLAGGGKIAHVNPLLRVEKESRQQFSRMWLDMGLGRDNTERGF